MTFRVLLLVRVLLLATAVILVLPERPLDTRLQALVAALLVETAVAGLAWRGVLPLLARAPVLCVLDAALVAAVYAEGGLDGPFYSFTVLTAAIAGVLYAWGPVLMVCVAQVCLWYVAAYLAAPSEDELAVLIALPVFYPLAACAGVGLRRLFDQYAEAEEGRLEAETAAAAAEERARLAREMHDSLAKTLHGIALSAAALPTWVHRSPERAEDTARQIVASLETASREARWLIADLRETAYGLPPAEAVRHVAAEWSRTHGVPVLARVAEPSAVELPPIVRYEVIAVLKEALANVARHAAAESVEVTMTWDPDVLVLTVRDDGAGFVAPRPNEGDGLAPLARAGHYGLVGMGERARRAGGVLDVRSAPGQGTTVTLRVPWGAEPAVPESEEVPAR